MTPQEYKELAMQLATHIYTTKVAANANNEDVIDLAKRIEAYLAGN